MKKTILSYNLPANKAARLRVLALHLGISVCTVEAGAQGCRLGDILEGRIEHTADAPVFEAELLVIAGLSQSELELLLRRLRAQKLPVALKAVLTDTNRDWTGAELYAQLLAERRAISEGKSSRHA